MIISTLDSYKTSSGSLSKDDNGLDVGDNSSVDPILVHASSCCSVVVQRRSIYMSLAVPRQQEQ